jgi:heme-degrading monooxygenase HmoA
MVPFGAVRLVIDNPDLMENPMDKPPEVPTDDKAVTLINIFNVPPDESDQFVKRWKDTARVMVGQPGFVGLRLLRSLIDDAQARFINVAEWKKGANLKQGYTNPEWRASVQRMLTDPQLHVKADPRVYEIVLELHPGDNLT